MTLSRFSLLSLAFGALVAAPSVFALDIPTNDGYVTDSANLLSSNQKDALDEDLRQYEAATSNQIAVLTISSLSGAEISDFAVEVGRKWGVGTTKNNGVMMVISYQDRMVNISPGYGLEGVLPDIVVKGIIDTDIVPAFRDGEYAKGITDAVESIKKHIAGEYTAERYTVKDSAGALPWILFFVFLFFNAGGAFLGRTKSWWLGGVFGGVFGIILAIIFSWWVSVPILVALGLLFDYIVSKGNWKGPRGGRGGFGGFGGGGFSGGNSGGFGGFGGGSFGGGGASGKW
jgi:uncharacterized protein